MLGQTSERPSDPSSLVRAAINAEAARQTSWLEEARGLQRLDAAGLKELEFRSRVSVSELEREVGALMSQIASKDRLDLKQDMRDLRDFLKQSLKALAEKSGAPLAFSSFVRLGAYAYISPSMFGKAKPMPGKPGEHSGLFYEAYGNGQLARLVKAKKGETVASLWLAEGVSEGRYSNTAWVEEYHSNGTIEEYGALFQHDPKKATMSFGSWAASRGFQVADS